MLDALSLHCSHAMFHQRSRLMWIQEGVERKLARRERVVKLGAFVIVSPGLRRESMEATGKSAATILVFGPVFCNRLVFVQRWNSSGWLHDQPRGFMGFRFCHRVMPFVVDSSQAGRALPSEDRHSAQDRPISPVVQAVTDEFGRRYYWNHMDATSSWHPPPPHIGFWEHLLDYRPVCCSFFFVGSYY